jgi:formate dehydrogenase subunit gamma
MRLRCKAQMPTLALLIVVAGLLPMPWHAAAQEAQEAQQAAPNPTAQSVTEQRLLVERRRIEGRVTIPDPNAAVLEQPQGRRYQRFHERMLPWIGGIVIIGMLLALAAFYAWRGRITLDRPLTGVKIKRFVTIERFAHWLTATSFILLALTGLNYVFGKRLLMPLMEPHAFSAWSQWAKYIHNAFPWPFMLGVLLMIGLWLKDNLPDRYDLEWLKQFGGFLSHRHPPARRFNAGQKLVFWSIVLGGLTLAASGLLMLFPNAVAGINGIQIAQYIHATVAMMMVAIILAHIYIGTIGMQGAADAMVSGEIDLAWAQEHHGAWLEEEQARATEGPQLGKGAIPAQ